MRRFRLAYASVSSLVVACLVLLIAWQVVATHCPVAPAFNGKAYYCPMGSLVTPTPVRPERR